LNQTDKKNQQLFWNKGKYVIVYMIVMGGVVGQRKIIFKYFFPFFWLLKEGFHFIDFEAMKTLFQFLKVFKTLEKNLQVTTSMGIAIIQHCIVFTTTKVAVHTIKYLYEVMTIDN